MDTEKEQAYGSRKANGDGRFLKWLKKHEHVPQHWGGQRTFHDDDIEKLFGKNSRKNQ